MSTSSRFFVRHVLGLVAAACAMLGVPYLASAISWKLSALLDGSGGMHVYGIGWGGAQASLDDHYVLIDPMSPAVLLALVSVAIVGVAGDLARHRLPWLTWCLPLVPAVPLGVWVARLTGAQGFPADLPPSVPFIVGVTVTVVTAVLVGAYWASVLVVGRATSVRAAP